MIKNFEMLSLILQERVDFSIHNRETFYREGRAKPMTFKSFETF